MFVLLSCYIIVFVDHSLIFMDVDRQSSGYLPELWSHIVPRNNKYIVVNFVLWSSFE
jgi:hypothetical protein